jgi:hypothetical protein
VLLQTSEHLAAVEIMRLKDIIILQNKIDLVTESVAQNQHEAIQKFIQGTIAGDAGCGGNLLLLGKAVVPALTKPALWRAVP